MAKPKSTISRDPYAFLGSTPPATPVNEKRPDEPPAATPEPTTRKKAATERITQTLPTPLLDRARNAAYWERMTLQSIIETALTQLMDQMEQGRGEPYPPREKELQAGRPIGSKSRNTSNA